MWRGQRRGETFGGLKFSPGDCFNKEWERFFIADRRSAKFSNKKNDKPKGAGKGVVIFFICIY